MTETKSKPIMNKQEIYAHILGDQTISNPEAFLYTLVAYHFAVDNHVIDVSNLEATASGVHSTLIELTRAEILETK